MFDRSSFQRPWWETIVLASGWLWVIGIALFFDMALVHFLPTKMRAFGLLGYGTWCLTVLVFVAPSITVLIAFTRPKKRLAFAWRTFFTINLPTLLLTVFYTVGAPKGVQAMLWLVCLWFLGTLGWLLPFQPHSSQTSHAYTYVSTEPTTSTDKAQPFRQGLQLWLAPTLLLYSLYVSYLLFAYLTVTQHVEWWHVLRNLLLGEGGSSEGYWQQLLFALGLGPIFASPFLLSYLAFQRWISLSKESLATWGWLHTGLWNSASAGFILFSFFVITSPKTLPSYLRSTQNNPTLFGPEARKQWRSQQEHYRHNILQLYTSPKKYVAATKGCILNNSFAQQTSWLLKLSCIPLRPFLYKDWKEPKVLHKRASRLYQRFFDAPLSLNEEQYLRRFHRASRSARPLHAGLSSIGAKRVWLAQQTIHLQPHHEWARWTLHEVYENKTDSIQEISYTFSLPEGAIISGLWLGKNGKRKHRYVVAPRGAAQRVYYNEVRQQEDPAWLQQTGPQQYHLRVFPIPVRSSKEMSSTAHRVHLWLEVQVLSHNKRWPAPVLLERRNVYWNNNTQRTLQGKTFASTLWWKPLPRKKNQRSKLRCITLAPSVSWKMEPLPSTPPVIRGKSIAIVIDRSWSMRWVKQNLKKQLSWVKNHIIPHHRVDLIFTTTSLWKEPPTIVKNAKDIQFPHLEFFGGMTTSTMLFQLLLLRKQQKYDAVLMLTDSSAFRIPSTRHLRWPSDVPLWFVHVGGKLSKGYSTSIHRAIRQSHGGVRTHVMQVMQAISWSWARPGITVRPMGNSLWSRLQPHEHCPKTPATKKTLSVPNNKASVWKAWAARAEMMVPLLSHPHLEKQEAHRLHSMAKRYSLVGPFSSMLVLVNALQRKSLLRWSRSPYRFQLSSQIEEFFSPVPWFASSATLAKGHSDDWSRSAKIVGDGATFWYNQVHFNQQGQPQPNQFPCANKGWICTPTQRSCSPDNSYKKKSTQTQKHLCWKQLGFSTPHTHRYQYCYRSEGTGTQARFILRAHADMDCDGLLSTFELQGTVHPATGEIVQRLAKPRLPKE